MQPEADTSNVETLSYVAGAISLSRDSLAGLQASVIAQNTKVQIAGVGTHSHWGSSARSKVCSPKPPALGSFLSSQHGES